MLNLPERQCKFEQLRAHWEAAETSEATKMVGRREKPTPHHIVHEDVQHTAGSKFRRKLSNGLAFISLTQRKNAPGHQLLSNASLPVSAPSTNNSSTVVLDRDALLSAQADSTPVPTSSDPPVPSQDSAQASEDLHERRQLPRSRTFSYIPRFVKVDCEARSVPEMDEHSETLLETVMNGSKVLPPTRIPTPNPPHSKPQFPSPRQYLPSDPPLQAGVAINRQSFTGVGNGSQSKAAVRSRTTPNLVKANNTPQRVSYMAPRRSGLKRPFASSTSQQPLLVENIPTHKRVAQRRSQIQDKAIKRESLAVPSAASNRRPFAPGARFAQSKHASFATPSIGANQLSSHLAQSPVTVKCSPTKVKEDAYEADSSLPSEETPTSHSRAKDAESSPRPTLSTVNLIASPLAPPSKIDADNDTQRRTLGTPNGLGGVWGSSKVFAAANHQVRRFPRSSTCHHLGRRPEAPPVPPIPNQYKLPPSSNLTKSIPQKYMSTSLSKLHHHFPIPSGQLGSSSRSLLSGIASTQKSIEAASVNFTSTSTSAAVYGAAEDAEQDSCADEAKGEYHFQYEASTSMCGAHYDAIQTEALSKSSKNLIVSPSVMTEFHIERMKRSVLISRSGRPTRELQSQRHWSISERFCPYSANDATRVQVKDYMPPLYWAGRFQSRFDQWRTEAMVAAIEPKMKPEDEGPLGQCNLDEDKKAMILIFMQLRDLCASAQAADSLYEFEYRYRKDRKMLDTKLDLPPSLRKPEESTPKGPIGRAVRRLTPRKASFANLFKGKSWNRSDDKRTSDMPRHVRELQEIANLSTDLEAAESGGYESSAQLHAC